MQAPYTIFGISTRVVEEASARYDTDDYFTIPTTDHFTVVKQTGKSVRLLESLLIL